MAHGPRNTKPRPSHVVPSSRIRVHAATGLRLSPHYGTSKIRWLLDHLPEVRRAADGGRLAVGPLVSFILFRMLRERPLVVDPANASRTLLWDLRSRAWSPPTQARS